MENLIYPRTERTAIKAVENTDGTVTLTGLALVFDEPGTRSRDLTGEYFTAPPEDGGHTYYGPAAKGGRITVDTLFHHGIPLEDSTRGRRLADALLGETTMTKAADGWLASLVLPMREDYEEEIAELAAQGKLGWSTGSAGHVVRKAADGLITRWPIVEVSPTPVPAEPRTFAVPLKSLWTPPVADGPSDPARDWAPVTAALAGINASLGAAALADALESLTHQLTGRSA